MRTTPVEHHRRAAAAAPSRAEPSRAELWDNLMTPSRTRHGNQSSDGGADDSPVTVAVTPLVTAPVTALVTVHVAPPADVQAER